MYYIWCARCLVENDFFRSWHGFLNTPIYQHIYMYLALGHVLDLADVSFCKKKKLKRIHSQMLYIYSICKQWNVSEVITALIKMSPQEK